MLSQADSGSAKWRDQRHLFLSRASSAKHQPRGLDPFAQDRESCKRAERPGTPLARATLASKWRGQRSIHYESPRECWSLRALRRCWWTAIRPDSRRSNNELISFVAHELD